MRTKDCPFLAVLSTFKQWVSPQHEKFLFGQSRKFRFDGAWRNAKRSCGCGHRIGTG